MSDTYYIISRALMDKGDSKTNRVLLSNEFIVFTNTIKHLGLGSGYLSGEFPGGTTTVNGAPVTAEVRALWRDLNGTSADGVVVAKTQSAPDGTWILTGLNPALKYDVVGRKAGFNDVIVSNVTPTSMVDITYTGAVIENADFTGADGFFELVGGIPPYSASVVTPLPLGLFPVVNGRQLIIDGTTGADEVASFDVKVTSSNGAEKIIPLQLVVGFKAPQNLKAETVVVNDVFSVVLTWETTNSTQQVKVYRSETPFDMDDLPEPIATLSGTSTTYTDDDVIEGDYFYYMVVAESGAHSFASEEIPAGVVRFTVDEEFTWFTEVGPHKFFTGNAQAVKIILVAGGGGTTSKNVGGGGGGGGVVQKTILVQPNTEYDIIVGAGGVASNGGNSSFGGEVAYGGGAGGLGGNSGHHPGGAGGSGGGAGGGWRGFSSSKGLGVDGQGYDGGEGYTTAYTSERASGGGGGAGGQGGNASSSRGGAGGVGVQIDLITTSIWVGGGGSGGTNGGTSTPATLGGGGSGGTYYAAGENGLPNTGGGAGASGERAGGALPSGGSGAVFVRRVLIDTN